MNKLKLLLLIIGLFASVSAVAVGWRFFLRAEEIVIPTEVKISNVSDNAATISYLTSKANLGTVFFGLTPEQLNSVAAEPEKQTVHYQELRNLKPATTYHFKIGSKSQTNTLFSFKTVPVAVIPPTPDEAYGKVKTSDGSPASQTIVFVTVHEGTQTSSLLSALTDKNGNFSLDLGNARNLDKGDFFLFGRNSAKILVEVQGGSGSKANLILSSAQTQPLPEIKLGTDEMADLSKNSLTEQQKTSQETRSKLQIPSEAQQQALAPPVTIPEINKAIAQQPNPTITIPLGKVVRFGEVISGTASPGATLTVTIYSDPVTATVVADGNGNWNIIVPSGLDPGTHTLTVSDGNGVANGSFVLVSSATKTNPKVLPPTGVIENSLFLLIGGIMLLITGIGFEFLLRLRLD